MRRGSRIAQPGRDTARIRLLELSQPETAPPAKVPRNERLVDASVDTKRRSRLPRRGKRAAAGLIDPRQRRCEPLRRGGAKAVERLVERESAEADRVSRAVANEDQPTSLHGAECFR